VFLSLPRVITPTNDILLDGYWKWQNTRVGLKTFFEPLPLPYIPAQSELTWFNRAILRIKKELEVAPAGKVWPCL